MKRVAVRLVVLVLLAVATTGLSAGRAMAATSVYDVGVTVYQSPYVRGSGSYTNGGAYTKVCVVIQSRKPFTSSWTNHQEVCRATPNPSSAAFSAPDVAYNYPLEPCREFRTRVQAWDGPVLYIPTKYSNTLRFIGCP